MVNHPNRSQTIEARLSRLNILVAPPAEFLTREGNRAFGPTIHVRYSYSEVPDDLIPTPDAPLGRGFPAEREVWDHNALNSAGSRGAFRNVYPVEEMRAFIAELQAVWGPLHVQDNSGLLPDLHESWAWYSVETPGMFLEYKLPTNDATMTEEHKRQYDELVTLAEACGASIICSVYRRG